MVGPQVENTSFGQLVIFYKPCWEKKKKSHAPKEMCWDQ